MNRNPGSKSHNREENLLVADDGFGRVATGIALGKKREGAERVDLTLQQKLLLKCWIDWSGYSSRIWTMFCDGADSLLVSMGKWKYTT
ncbi:MAG: hypothetical protein IM534_02900 [Chitinophagaceae bacterium]|jgi:hypothetical protein|nr:hypothetical protein [Chitinophagaceae bacterium]MCE2973297.1 hypothetical protein [Sediminibacterium sp.]MCA6481656.1 hypothetical protein [Chitinophagaceae bacterium]MCA6486020.1 hypothetical protein [Chitinophagaceae bacterium]MCA6486784.1 hypothetical protein [Chitinophagaceae bacterium]